MNNARKEKRAWWANHIKAWKASGKTQSGYCRQHQIKPHQLIYWKQVFETGSEQVPASSGFIPVQVASSQPRSQGLTVRLSNGVCVEGIQTDNLTITQTLIEWLT